MLPRKAGWRVLSVGGRMFVTSPTFRHNHGAILSSSSTTAVLKRPCRRLEFVSNCFCSTTEGRDPAVKATPVPGCSGPVPAKDLTNPFICSVPSESRCRHVTLSSEMSRDAHGLGHCVRAI